MDDFIRKANLVPWYLLFLLICGTEKLEEFPEDIVSLRAANICVLFFRLQRHPGRSYSRLLEQK